MALQSTTERVSLSQIIGICTSADLQLHKPNRHQACCGLSIWTRRNVLDLALLWGFYLYIYLLCFSALVTHIGRTRRNPSPSIFHSYCALSFYILLLSFTDVNRAVEQCQQWLLFAKLAVMSAYCQCLVLFYFLQVFGLESLWSQWCVVNI